MSSTSPEHQTNRLRLSSARHRIRAFLEQVDYLKASSFPHSDGRDALNLIEKYFRDRLDELGLPDDSASEVVDLACSHSIVAIAKYTEILGFILRSTNVRNAFEVHHPLKRIVRQLLGTDAKVLISSEWNFTPFTYPMNIDVLPNFALLGGPATESNNVLILPLAGHEIGHSIWKSGDFQSNVQALLSLSIEKTFDENKDELSKTLVELRIGELGRGRLKQTMLDSGIRQLEEIFCDSVGLYMFGESFLYSFEYFLAPGIGGRDSTYPSDLDRIAYMKSGCAKLELILDPLLFQRWADSKPMDGPNGRILRMLDQSVHKVAENVIDGAIQTMQSKGLPKVNAMSVARIQHSFSRGEPEDENASVAEIICAGWKHLRTQGPSSDVDEAKAHKFLGELMLKSIEIAEFRTRLEGHA